MSKVQVIQRDAHLAGPVKLEFVSAKEGRLAKGTLTAITNVAWRKGDERREEATVLRWVLWGKQAENAAEYLGKGSHVNIDGRLRNNNYTDGEGRDVFGLEFTVDEIDYLDTKADAEARATRAQG